MARKQPAEIPSTRHSKIVPTEYEVKRSGWKFVLSDDRGRNFSGLTLNSAFRRAERAQDPLDPIHHEPYPHPSDVPLR